MVSKHHRSVSNRREYIDYRVTERMCPTNEYCVNRGIDLMLMGIGEVTLELRWISFHCK